eukprot:SAG31_NODE_1463_length_8238_cov_3.389851_13_plen_141_part_00
MSGSDHSPLMPNISYQQDAKTLLSSSANWVKLFDSETGHFRCEKSKCPCGLGVLWMPDLVRKMLCCRVKDAEGNFASTFDEFAWGPKPGYTEAGPWQYRFEVPYDPKRLQASHPSISESLRDCIDSFSVGDDTESTWMLL